MKKLLGLGLIAMFFAIMPSNAMAKCLDFQTSLYQGLSDNGGSDISDLQNFLRDQGNYSGTSNGIFDSATKAAVTDFQFNVGLIKDRSVPNAGGVGRLTSAKIKEVSCGASASSNYVAPARSLQRLNPSESTVGSGGMSNEAIMALINSLLQQIAQLQAEVAQQQQNNT